MYLSTTEKQESHFPLSDGAKAEFTPARTLFVKSDKPVVQQPRQSETTSMTNSSLSMRVLVEKQSWKGRSFGTELHATIEARGLETLPSR